MDDDARRHLDTYIAMDKFGDENAPDFPPLTPGGVTFIDLKAVIAAAQASAGDQLGAFGEARQQREIKGTKRSDVRSKMTAIHTLADSMEYAFDGISDKFRMPRNRSDADLLAGARAFAAEALPYEADFIAYGLSATFIADLTAAADAFEASLSDTAGARLEHVEATAEITDWITQGMRLRTILDGIVKIKYANDPGKLAAWNSARHIVRPPKTNETP